jgi:glycosyltransferase involved in cell wall biosynthesis
MIKITACVITYNEEKNIRRCLEALRDVADEIIVIDSFSEDTTVEISESLGATVIQRPFTGYGEQKLFAQQQAANKWVLSIDADEVLSEQLRKTILGVKANPKFTAYKMNRLTNYCGKWIRHCGWYPDSVLRLWNTEKGSMVVHTVHEGVVMHDQEEVIGHLKGDLLHYSYNTISDHLSKMQLYTELGARADVERGKKTSLFKLVLGPKWQFFVDFVLRLGFLDGYYGYIVCRNSAFASFIKYAKIRQYSRLKEQGLNF